MAYLVLARKYRPESFAEMIGQEHVTRTIRNAIKEDRVHHAYLFCGVRGLGKTTAARILAKCLVCENGPTAQPCNACEQCVAVNEARSVDVIEIDGASNNKVEHVRGLREQVNYLPQSARRKVYIIDEVHMLTDSAFNALLKTLEEPPPHVTFIFATTDPHKVLPTILSRVSRLDFRRVKTAELVAHLRMVLGKEHIEADEEALHLVASASEGSVRDALTLLDKVIAFAADPRRISPDEVRTILGHADRFAIAELLDAVFARDARVTLSRFEGITREGGDLLQLAIAVLSHLRDLTVVKLCPSREVVLDVSDALFERLSTQAEGVAPATLAQYFDRFSRVLEGLETSQVPRLAVEMALLDLVHSEPLIPMGDLIDRLRHLGQERVTGDKPVGAGGSSGSGARTRGSAPAASERPRASGMPSSRAPSTPTTSETTDPEPPPRAAQSDLARTLWGMVGDSLGAEASPTAVARETFSLTPASEALPEPISVVRPDEGACPSSRCTPREPIPWKTMSPLAAWEALLDCIRGEDELLFAVLGGLGLSRLSDGVLELAAPRASFAREQLDEHPELRASLARFVDEYFGDALELRLLDATPSLPELPSLVLLEEGRRRDRQTEVEARAHQNSKIRVLLSSFDGRVRSVTPLGPSQG